MLINEYNDNDPSSLKDYESNREILDNNTFYRLIYKDKQGIFVSKFGYVNTEKFVRYVSSDCETEKYEIQEMIFNDQPCKIYMDIESEFKYEEYITNKKHIDNLLMELLRYIHV